MFNEKQTNAYKNITAPLELRERVLNTENRPTVFGKTSSLKQIRNIATLAACICLIVAVGIIFNSNNSVSVSMNGASLSQEAKPLNTARASVAAAQSLEEEIIEIPLEITLSGKTDITANDGKILNSSYEVCNEQTFEEEKISIIWQLSANREKEYTLEIESKKDSCTVMLIFNNAENLWKISCTNK